MRLLLKRNGCESCTWNVCVLVCMLVSVCGRYQYTKYIYNVCLVDSRTDSGDRHHFNSHSFHVYSDDAFLCIFVCGQPRVFMKCDFQYKGIYK